MIKRAFYLMTFIILFLLARGVSEAYDNYRIYVYNRSSFPISAYLDARPCEGHTSPIIQPGGSWTSTEIARSCSFDFYVYDTDGKRVIFSGGMSGCARIEVFWEPLSYSKWSYRKKNCG